MLPATAPSCSPALVATPAADWPGTPVPGPASPPLRLALTAGEPAGIGPDLLIELAQHPVDWQRVALADPAVLEQRARSLGKPLRLVEFDPDRRSPSRTPGELALVPLRTAVPVIPGQLAVENAAQVLALLETAASGCLNGRFDAMVTGPVQKEIIHRAGHAFTGHTEWLAERAGIPLPVMLLVADTLRVALATTHLPLRAVPDAITPERLTAVLTVLDQGLRRQFALAAPRILVCGLNPHAGEQGMLGTEEQTVLIPTLEALRAQGLHLIGPVPADTAFTPRQLAGADAILALYHDQGLPVLKHAGFGHAVNVTLGLPFVRTSVDHGTALSLAGTGAAEWGSFLAAERLAVTLVQNRMAAEATAPVQVGES